MANSITLSFLAGALLMAAPLFSQVGGTLPAWADPVVKQGAAEPAWFQLTENRDQVGAMLGKPVLVADSGKDFYSWQYQMDSTDEDYSHYAVFRKTDGKLISVTRQYEPERNVDVLFPVADTTVCYFPDSSKPTFAVRVRRLSGGRLLMAMGTSKPGQITGQLLLIRESEVGHFYPWIPVQLAAKP